MFVISIVIYTKPMNFEGVNLIIHKKNHKYDKPIFTIT